MGRSCCVPMCRSNYSASAINVSTFQFPKSPERRELWKKKILRRDLKVTPHSGVCIKHFDPQFIIRSDIFKTVSGNIEIPRQIPKLTADAFPSIFPDWPDHRTERLPLKRTDPNERAEKILQRQLQEKRKAHLASIKAAVQAQLVAIEANKIKSFDDFKNSLPYKNIEPFTAAYRESYIVFLRVDDDFWSVPAVKVCFKVCENLDVNVFINNECINKYHNLLGDNLKCDQWSKLSSLISSLGSSDSSQTLFDEIRTFVGNTTKTIEDRDDLDSEILLKLKFLLEQLSLVTFPVPRYSPEMLTWAAALFDTHPRAYTFLRKSNHLTLPNPHYLQKFLGSLKNIITGSDNRNLDIECEGEASLAVQQLCQSLELDAPVSDSIDAGNPTIECRGEASLALQQLCQSLELDVPLVDDTDDGNPAVECEGISSELFCQSFELSAPVSDSSDHTYSLDNERKKIINILNIKDNDEYLQNV